MVGNPGRHDVLAQLVRWRCHADNSTRNSADSSPGRQHPGSSSCHQYPGLRGRRVDRYPGSGSGIHQYPGLGSRRADQHHTTTDRGLPGQPKYSQDHHHHLARWAADYLAAKQAIFAAYVQAHPDVAIKLLNVSDIGTKAQNAVPAGVGPDIIAWVDDKIGQNALIGVIDPLDGKAGIDAELSEAELCRSGGQRRDL